MRITADGKKQYVKGDDMKKTDTLLNKKAVSVVAAGALALSLTPTVALPMPTG